MDPQQLLQKEATTQESIFLNSLKLLDLTPIQVEAINIQDQSLLNPCNSSENKISLNISSTQPSKDETTINVLKIEEISNEEEQQNDTINGGVPLNSQEISSTFKKKRNRRKETKHILDNVEVNKLKNFYKTFMNRISVILKAMLSKDKSMGLLIDEICSHSNQRSFLDLFPHLKPCQEDNNSSCYFTYQHVSQLQSLRKIAFKHLGLKFNQMIRIVKSSRSFTQTEEFIYGCLYFAQRSEQQHRKQNLPPDILEIVSAEKPFVNFEFRQPVWEQNQNEMLEFVQQQQDEGQKMEKDMVKQVSLEKSQQYCNYELNERGSKEQQKKTEWKNQNIQIQVSELGYRRIEKNSFSYPEEKKQQQSKFNQQQQLPTEKEEGEQIHFFQGLTIKSNGTIEFQRISTATNSYNQTTQIFNPTTPIRNL